MSPRRTPLVLIGLVLLTLASFALARHWGSGGFGLEVEPAIALWRMDRAWAAFIVGGLLALAGCLMQLLLRNPLADPYVLGTSGGAAVGVLTALLLGMTEFGRHLAAFAGALLSIGLVFGLSARRFEPLRLLLTGIVVAAGWGALVSLGLALTPDRQLPGLMFWLLGEIGEGTPNALGLGVLATGLALALFQARGLDLLRLGDAQAALLGLPVARLRLGLYFLAAALTATAVSLAGSIGFVGLVVPHLLRLAGLSHHRVLLPGAVLAGGSLLVLASVLARTVAAPLQLPVGAITALIGVPLFLVLLRSTRA